MAKVRLNCLLEAVLAPKTDRFEDYKMLLLDREGPSYTAKYKESLARIQYNWQHIPSKLDWSSKFLMGGSIEYTFSMDNENVRNAVKRIVNYDQRVGDQTIDILLDAKKLNSIAPWQFWSKSKGNAEKEAIKAQQYKMVKDIQTVSSDQMEQDNLMLKNYHCMNIHERNKTITKNCSLVSEFELQHMKNHTGSEAKLYYLKFCENPNNKIHEVPISVPDLCGWFTTHGNQITGTNNLLGDKQTMLQSCIFVLSYGRVHNAKLEYGNMGHDKAIQYQQIIVVRDGSEFDQYRNVWGQSHVILALPQVSASNVHVSHGGCGFARNMIQHVAATLKMNFITMLDDNVSDILWIYM
jgi:hypothetical protein